VILAIADPHIHDSAARNEPIRDLVRQACDRMGRDGWLAILGDLTDSGTERQYAQAMAMLQPLRGRLILVPGNHDGGLLGIFVQAAARRRWARLVRELAAPTRIELDGRLIQVVDSCLYTTWPWDLARGRVGSRQMARVRSAIGEGGRRGLRPTILLHHWPYSADVALRLEDAAALLRLVEGHADLVAGHTHERDGRAILGSVARCVGGAREIREIYEMEATR